MLKYFHGAPLKNYLHEYLMHEYMHTRKFPNLRYLLHNTYTCVHKLNVGYMRICVCVMLYRVLYNTAHIQRVLFWKPLINVHVSMASILIFIMEDVLTCTWAS